MIDAATRPSDISALPPVELLQGASLFLDFDGTLVELAERPDAVQVDARLAALMTRLLDRLGGRVAIISGRPLAQIQTLFHPTLLAISGSHGMEFCTSDGRIAATERPAALASITAAMQEFAAARPGVLVEEKPLGAALHYRQAPGAEADSIALARSLAEQHGLYLQSGKMMAEVRAGGGDKGAALRQMMREPGMAGTRPVFMGDDDTDEPALAAAAELGGAGILIGAHRPSAARYRLNTVEETLTWLEQAAEKAA